MLKIQTNSSGKIFVSLSSSKTCHFCQYRFVELFESGLKEFNDDGIFRNVRNLSQKAPMMAKKEVIFNNLRSKDV